MKEEEEENVKKNEGKPPYWKAYLFVTAFTIFRGNSRNQIISLYNAFKKYKLNTFSITDIYPKDVVIGQDLLVDCRLPEERAVSMINTAISLEEFYEKEKTYPEDTRIVVYCTIGLRSGLVVEDIKNKTSKKNVLNLAGSILLWAHDRDTLNITEKRVHCYYKLWDFLPESYEGVYF